MNPNSRAFPAHTVGDDHFRDHCGIFAVHGNAEAAKLTYLGLYALQHRGQESAGIAVSDGGKIVAHKGMGHVADVFTKSVLEGLPGRLAIGHTRYSTAGDTDLKNAQPLVVSCQKGQVALAHNGNLVNASASRKELESRGDIFQTTSDTEVIVHHFARSRQSGIPEAVADALDRVKGAYSLVLLFKDTIYGIRDPYGFRPLALGRLGEGPNPAWVLASETCAFDLIGARYVRDVEPGEMVILDGRGPTSLRLAPPQPKQCIFEHVYFSRPDSLVFGRSVQASREMLGRQLALEHPADADLVVPVPDSGVAAASGYAEQSQIPLKFGLIRNHYVGRTFIEPQQAIRDFGVRLKLNPVARLLEGKRVVLVDDSIIRGTTSRKIVRIVKEAGAREVHVRISCPPTVSPCYYGVDTPTRAELIAATHSVEGIREFIGADSLGYLSLEGLRKAVEDTKGNYCLACYTAEYPTTVQEQLIALRNRD
ncbi:MAG TPA: amidophosphoribosyltransferase [Terriglobia bacterium]|nr:amidophosphoribosyltransferase [Terriglobia bacterium]